MDKPISGVSVLVNDVDTGVKSTISGTIKVGGLNEGDVITFKKYGLVCLTKIKIPNDLKENKIVMYDKSVVELPKVVLRPTANAKCEVVEKENGEFCVNVEVPEGYFFDGYYVNGVLVSRNADFTFSKSMRGEVGIKLSNIYNFKLMSFDGKATYLDKSVVYGDKIKLKDCFTFEDVFVGYYEKDKLVSCDLDYKYEVKGNAVVYVKTEKPKLLITKSGREVTVDANVNYETYVDNSLVNAGNRIKLTDYVKEIGEHTVTVKSEKYNLSESVVITLENPNKITSPSVLLCYGKYYLVFDNKAADFDLVVNNVKYDFSSKNGINYADISPEISNGLNDISAFTKDVDGIKSEEAKVSYVKYYTPNSPKISVNDNVLKVEKVEGITAKLYVNYVYVSDINSEIDLSGYHGKLSVRFSGEYINTFFVDVVNDSVNENSASESKNTFAGCRVSTSKENKSGEVATSEKALEIVEQQDEVYAVWSLPSLSCESVLNINGVDYPLKNGTRKFNLTDYLIKNANNKIILTIISENGEVRDAVDYYFNNVLNIDFTYESGVIYLKSEFDYCEVKVNGILLNQRFNVQNIDINYYILSNCELDVEIIGYKDGVMAGKTEFKESYEKTRLNKEYVREITLKGERYLAVEFLNQGEYFIACGDNYVKVDSVLTKIGLPGYDLVVRSNGKEQVLFSK